MTVTEPPDAGLRAPNARAGRRTGPRGGGDPRGRDTLNTHQPGALYETFAPAAARRLLETGEFPYTPKHGSGLNMAEIAFRVLSR